MTTFQTSHSRVKEARGWWIPPLWSLWRLTRNPLCSSTWRLRVWGPWSPRWTLNKPIPNIITTSTNNPILKTLRKRSIHSCKTKTVTSRWEVHRDLSRKYEKAVLQGYDLEEGKLEADEGCSVSPVARSNGSDNDRSGSPRSNDRKHWSALQSLESIYCDQWGESAE